MFHFVLEFEEERAGDVSHCSLGKFFKRCTLGLAIDLLEFFFENGSTHFETFLEGLFKSFVGFLLSALTLRFANVAPSSLDVRDGTLVNRVNV